MNTSRLRGLRRAAVATAAVALTATLMSSTSSADAAAPAPAPSINAYSGLAANWWQWGLEQPASVNPVTDTTGAFCRQGQAGPVWFLAGTLGSGTVNRNCSVPFGKSLFFPLVNAFSGALATDKPKEQTVAYQRSVVASNDVKSSTGLSATLDGKSVSNAVAYEDSLPFSVVLPADNLFGVDAGTVVQPTVDSGYYAFLPPLLPGAHTIRFTGQMPGQDAVDVTYQITVSPFQK